MKRIFSIAIRDFKSSLRDAIVLYIIVAPLVIAYLMAGFVPTAETAQVTVGVTPDMNQVVVDALSDTINVEVFDNREALEERVKAIDDYIGLEQVSVDNYVFVVEGNEAQDTSELLQALLLKIRSEQTGQTRDTVTVDFSSIGVKESPIAVIGLVSIAIMALVLGGMIVSMNIIEEKDSQTFTALNATPLSRFEFITGKSLAGSIIAIIQVMLTFLIFGYNDVNFIQVFFMAMIGLSIVIIMGFILGLVSPNQMAAVANMKVLFLPISISVIGALVLPKAQHFVLWWSPFYWLYDGMTAIINKNATWLGLLIDALGVTVITVIVYLLFRKKIHSNLQKV